MRRYLWRTRKKVDQDRPGSGSAGVEVFFIRFKRAQQVPDDDRSSRAKRSGGSSTWQKGWMGRSKVVPLGDDTGRDYLECDGGVPEIKTDRNRHGLSADKVSGSAGSPAVYFSKSVSQFIDLLGCHHKQRK